MYIFAGYLNIVLRASCTSLSVMEAERDWADFVFFIKEFTVVVQIVNINFTIQNVILVFRVLNYRLSQNYVNTVTECGIIYSPRNVCPDFKWYCCSLVTVC